MENIFGDSFVIACNITITGTQINNGRRNLLQISSEPLSGIFLVLRADHPHQNHRHHQNQSPFDPHMTQTKIVADGARHTRKYVCTELFADLLTF